MGQTAMMQVLGAIAYGEQKAHDDAAAMASAAADDRERRAWRKIAAEELRHYKGFVRRLQAMGADPERAMAPYRAALDRYHRAAKGSEVEEAVWAYLGEGVADDLLSWFRTVADPETAAFIDTVLADEEEHEARAAGHLRTLLQGDPARRAEATRAARSMLTRMIWSGSAGGASLVRFGAFLRLGSPHELLGRLGGGYLSRLRAIGIDPIPLSPLRLLSPARLFQPE